MQPVRTTIAQASAVILSLALAACAGSSESSPTISEAAASELFAACSTASITVDRRDQFQASIAGFLEGARTSGCSYGSLQIAGSPQEDEGSDGAFAVASDFVEAFELPWTLAPEIADPDLPAHDVRVTLFASDFKVAEAS